MDDKLYANIADYREFIVSLYNSRKYDRIYVDEYDNEARIYYKYIDREFCIKIRNKNNFTIKLFSSSDAKHTSIDVELYSGSVFSTKFNKVNRELYKIYLKIIKGDHIVTDLIPTEFMRNKKLTKLMKNENNKEHN